MFAATTSPWYLPTWVSCQMPVTSPIAHRRSPARRRASTGIPWPSAATPTVSRPMLVDARAPAGGDEQAVAAQLAAVVELEDVVLALAPRGGRRARRGRARFRRRRRTSPSASPSGAGSRASTCSAPSTSATSPPRRRTACAISTPTGPAAEDEQPARHRLHAGHLAVGPDALELAQARDRRHDRVGAARPATTCSAVWRTPSTSTTPGPASRPVPAQQVDAVVGQPALLAGVGVVRRP